MELRKVSKRLVITGAILILAIKFIVRPLYLADDAGKFFLGIAPNLLGSFLVPFGVYWFFSREGISIARIFKIQSPYDLRVVCMVGLGLLIINEYLQLIPYFGRTFDYFDIIFSAVGLSISYFVFEKIDQRYQAQPD